MLALILTLLLQDKPAKEFKQIQTFTVTLTPKQIESWKQGRGVSITLAGCRAADSQTAGYRLFLNLPEDTQIPNAPHDLLPKNLPNSHALDSSSKNLVSETYLAPNAPGKDAPGMICHLSFKTPKDRGLEIDPSQPMRFTVLAIPDKNLGNHIAKVSIDDVSLEFYTKYTSAAPEKKK